jgi:hypothetical protein
VAVLLAAAECAAQGLAVSPESHVSAAPLKTVTGPFGGTQVATNGHGFLLTLGWGREAMRLDAQGKLLDEMPLLPSPTPLINSYRQSFTSASDGNDYLTVVTDRDRNITYAIPIGSNGGIGEAKDIIRRSAAAVALVWTGGRYLFAFVDDARELRLLPLDRRGAPIGPEMLISERVPAPAPRVSLAWNGTMLLAVWQSTATTIRAQYLTAAGEFPVALHPMAFTIEGTEPSASAAGSDLLLAWRDSDLRVARVHDTGLQPFAVIGGAASARNTRLAFEGQHVAVNWSDGKSTTTALLDLYGDELSRAQVPDDGALAAVPGTIVTIGTEGAVRQTTAGGWTAESFVIRRTRETQWKGCLAAGPGGTAAVWLQATEARPAIMIRVGSGATAAVRTLGPLDRFQASLAGGAGTYLLVYSDDLVAVVGILFDASGHVLGPGPFQIAALGGLPVVAWDGSNYVVAFFFAPQRFSPAAPGIVRISERGEMLDPNPVPLRNPRMFASIFTPLSIGTAAGRTLVSWDGEAGGEARFVTKDGPAGDLISVAPAPDYGYVPIAIASSGREFLVCWQRWTSTRSGDFIGVRQRVVSFDGTAGPERIVEEDGYNRPPSGGQLVWDGRYYILVHCPGPFTRQPGISAWRFDPSGAPLGEPVIIVEPADQYTTDFAAVATEGRVRVIYSNRSMYPADGGAQQLFERDVLELVPFRRAAGAR